MNSAPGNPPSSGPFTYTSMTHTVAQAPVDVRLNFIRKTYAVFLASLVVAMFGCGVGLHFPALRNVIGGFGFIGFIALFGLLFLAQAVGRVPVLNYLALFAFTGLMGLMLSPLMYLYALHVPGAIPQAAVMTIIIFGTLTGYAFVSRRDFSFLRGMLCVALVGLILGGIVNVFFFHSSMVGYVFAWISLVVFSGYVLYDTSNIIHRYDERDYCPAAMALFLDFINIFLALLQILGNNRD